MKYFLAILRKPNEQLDIVVDTCNPYIWETEAGGF
jgi:hypothetical protein